MPKFIAPDGTEYKTKTEYCMTIFPRKEGESTSTYLARYKYHFDTKHKEHYSEIIKKRNKERYHEDAEYRKKKIEEAKKRFRRTYVHKFGPHQRITCSCCCTCNSKPLESICV